MFFYFLCTRGIYAFTIIFGLFKGNGVCLEPSLQAAVD